MNLRPTLRRAAIASTSLLLLYTAFGFLAVPAILKSQSEQLASAKLHRQLSFGKVAFNPFTLDLVIEGLSLKEPKGDAVFVSAQRIEANLSAQSLWKLAPIVQQLRVDQPYVHLLRDGAGQYSIADILRLIAEQPPSPEPARFSVNNIRIDGGRIVFDDQPAHSTHQVEGLRLGVPSLSSMPADVKLFVEPLLEATVNGAPLLFKGKAHPFADAKDMQLELKLDNVALPPYLEYLPFKPAFKLNSARLGGHITASFRQGSALVIGGELGLKDLDLLDGAGKPLLKLASLDVALGSLDIFAGKFDLARIAIDGLDARVARDSKGRVNLAQLGGPETPPQPAVSSAGVRVTLKELAVRNAALRYADPSLHASMDNFNLDLQGLAFDTARRTVSVASISSDSARVALGQDVGAAPASNAAAGAPYTVTLAKVALAGWSLDAGVRSHGETAELHFAPLALTLQDVSTAPGARMQLDLQATAGKAGKLGASGTLGLAPLHAQLALDIDKLSLLPLQPFATESVNLRLTQGALSTHGKLTLDSGANGVLKGSYQGDASVNHLETVDQLSATDFVRWNALTLAGMDVQLEPFSISVDKVSLADFFARVIIDKTGRINLQDVRRTGPAGQRSLTDAAERANAPEVAPAPAADEALPPIRINTLALTGGKVRFTDNFIRPNYTASLNELHGAVTGLSSVGNANAGVELKGLVNSAPLAITGRINPLQRNLFLDIKADVRGIELATLSAYADKYVGYGIDKGKLSFEVAYQLQDRQLTSQNRLILDQLTFGDESSNPDVKRLPVRLAVALLSDRNGIIDISVPIGGTLDDPQFSVGGIVLQIIGNVIVKTATAPFALLAKAFGGGEQMSTLEFDAGRATINPAAEANLTVLAKALQERPGLKLDVVGRSNPVTDLDALKVVAIERKVRALKTRDLQARGAALPAGAVVVGKDEYLALLKRVFKDETFAKPRNAIGMQKSLDQAEMEALMRANVKIDNDDLLTLARRRSQAAKDWLVANGSVAVERIYLVAPEGDDGSGKAAPSCRADFTLR
ncbi:MAG: DUF748 domain-containing protein [Pseudomonadota bacterium]